MLPPALLLGDPARLPFPGHLRLRLGDASGGLCLAARIGAGDDLVAAWNAARCVERKLRQALQTPGPDRHDLLRRLWEALRALPAEQLGPQGGRDLSLLVVAADAQGIGVAGVGLSMVWARRPGELSALVEPGHPLLGPTGRPETFPGVLTLDRLPGLLAVVGCGRHLDPSPPPIGELDRRCGLRGTEGAP